MGANETIKIRFFFDYGSGVCLWAGDNYTSNLLGYPISIEADFLALDTTLIAEANRLIDLYDESLNWESPLDDSPWSQETWSEFFEDTRKLYSSLREAFQECIILVNDIDYW